MKCHSVALGPGKLVRSAHSHCQIYVFVLSLATCRNLSQPVATNRFNRGLNGGGMNHGKSTVEAPRNAALKMGGIFVATPNVRSERL